MSLRNLGELSKIMSTITQTQGVNSTSEEIESIFKELKALPIELQERGRFVPISMEEDPDIINTYFMIKELNESLLRSQNDAVSAFAAANNLFASYSILHESFKRSVNNVKAALGIQTSRVVSRIQSLTIRFDTVLNKMVAQAASMVKKHSKELSLSSIVVTFNSSPQSLTASYNYSKSK